MKKIFFLFVILGLYKNMLAQNVGIGTTVPNTSAQVDITSNNKGLLIPRMATSAITSISNPAKGLMVYDSAQNQLMVNMGTPAVPSWQTIAANSSWGLAGNSGTSLANNFIGTKDAAPLVLKVNNARAAYIDTGFGSFYHANTSFGYKALSNNNNGSYNTANGYSSLYSNTTGTNNTANGAASLYFNTTGFDNTSNGGGSLYSNTTGFHNTSNGAGSLNFNTTGFDNTSNGAGSLYSNTIGYYNTANGYNSLHSNIIGYSNAANGYNSLYSNTDGQSNTANGYNSLYSNTDGYFNTANGYNSLFSNTTGVLNIANGYSSLFSSTYGSYNTAVGNFSLDQTIASNYNTAVGYNAGSGNDNGYNNVFLGANTGAVGPGYYNVIAIGQGTICTAPSQVTMGNSATNSYRIYGGWVNISDGRFKKNIKENVPGLSFILKLKPITYNLQAKQLDAFIHRDNKPKASLATSTGKQGTDLAQNELYQKALAEKEKITQTGFVAQDVEKAANDLGFDFSGVDKPKNGNDYYGLRYAEFVVPLVKAVQEQQEQIELFKKENKTQQDIITDLQKQMNELKALIKK
jgi:trimeric autotransporter adhesin